MAEYDVEQRLAPPSASAPRRAARVELIVLHTVLGAYFDALASFCAQRAAHAPHY